MLLKREIEKVALQKQVSRSTIDKDWVLGHFIDAIFSVERCRDALIFKGGTCLKKCYFADYRFSEDLYFTSADSGFVLDMPLLEEITAIVTARTEIPLYIDSLKELRHKDMLTGFAAIVKFWGADHLKNQVPPAPERWATSIKLEVILYEKILFPPVERAIAHPYTDGLVNSLVPCYDLREVITEKLRALIQRSYTAPRDYYDIWYLSRTLQDIDWRIIIEAFHEKMSFKNLKFSGMDQLLNEDVDRKLKAAWGNSLAHQIPYEKLPAYDLIRSELEALFRKLFA